MCDLTCGDYNMHQKLEPLNQIFFTQLQAQLSSLIVKIKNKKCFTVQAATDAMYLI